MFDHYLYPGYDPYSQLLTGILAAYALALGVVLLIPFFLRGIGLHRMAKNAGMRRPWLALIPVGQGYILGSLAGRSFFFFRGRRRSLGRINLWLSLGRLACAIPLLVGLVRAASAYSAYAQFAYPYRFGGAEGVFMLLSLAGWVVSMAATGFMWYSLYYLYLDYTPGYQLPLLLLSIFGGSVATVVIMLTQMNAVPASVLGGIPQERPLYNRYPGGYGPQGPPPPWQPGGPPPSAGPDGNNPL